jgi:transcriptional regulator with XRE-family HTH domain
MTRTQASRLDRLQQSLRAWRERADLSQRALAQLAGIDRSTLRRLETGGRVRPFYVMAASRALTEWELFAA